MRLSEKTASQVPLNRAILWLGDGIHGVAKERLPNILPAGAETVRNRSPQAESTVRIGPYRQSSTEYK